MIKEFLKEISGISFIDIGSSGYLDAKWKNLESFIDLIGFDPNVEECERMSKLPNNFHSLKYLPFALSGDSSSQTLYKTKSIYCYSLLEPNTEWLQRFSFGDLFERIGEEKVNTVKLNDVQMLKDNDTDIIKIDTQGLELPILSNAEIILDKSFLVETETGFVDNYKGETTYAQIDSFMRSKGFLLFDINTNHRVPRNNHFKEVNTGKEQILWCEATWMKDYVALVKKDAINPDDINREKALKILIICAQQGCVDYGYELALLFSELKLIDDTELKNLETRENWLIVEDSNEEDKSNVINLMLRLLPSRLRREISKQAQKAASQKHLFHS